MATPTGGSSVSVKGQLDSRSDFYFNGDFEGTIEATTSHVKLGPNANVRGNIRARQVSVSGSVLGDVVAVEQIALRAGSRVEGNLRCGRICMEDGTNFQGRVEIRDSDKAKGLAGSSVLRERYTRLLDLKYGRGLTEAEARDLDGAYRELIAGDGEFWGLLLVKSAVG